MACNAFVQAVKTYNPPILRTYKIHLLLHLPQCLRDDGPPSSYDTERYEILKVIHKCISPWYRCEAFNSLVRERNIHSHRHPPSHDIAVGFAVREQFEHIVSGGLYGPNNDRYIIYNQYHGSLVAHFTCRCSNDILMLFKSPEVQQFMYGGKMQSKSNISIKKVMKYIYIYINLHICTLHRTVQSYPVSRYKEWMY